MCREPVAEARPTTSAVSSGGTWKTPKPSWGISVSPRIAIRGTWSVVELMPHALAGRHGDQTGRGATPLADLRARVWHPVGVNATVHERRAPASRRATRRRSRSRVPFFVLGFLVVLGALAVVGGAYAYDHSRSDRIAPGVKI